MKHSAAYRKANRDRMRENRRTAHALGKCSSCTVRDPRVGMKTCATCAGHGRKR